MDRRIRWTSLARQDSRQIFDYWKQRNKSVRYGSELLGIFEASVAKLKTQPFIGRIANSENTRILNARNYLIIYEILEDEVLILRVWDSRQNPGKLTRIITR